MQNFLVLIHAFHNVYFLRLIKLAQILDSLVVNDTPDPGSLIRSDSNESMQSALSSLGNTGSWTGSYMHDPIGKYTTEKS